jgi:2-keto-4-pentenoate hydratase
MPDGRRAHIIAVACLTRILSLDESGAMGGEARSELFSMGVQDEAGQGAGRHAGWQDEACDLLHESWLRGSVIEALPVLLRPRSRAEAYSVQASFARHNPLPQAGWKIAATSSAGQKHINVDGPMAGRLFAERRVKTGGTVALGANRMRVAEPEFAFRFGRDLPPRAAEYDLAEVLDAVESLHPAIEIPDSRYARFTSVGADQLIADNACAHLFAIGEAAPDTWRGLDLAAHAVHASLDGAPFQGSGANVLGDPRLALAWLVNELSRFGICAQKGQYVMTGTCMIPLAIVPGSQVKADFGVIGGIELRFA